jgi:pyruvyltransferase
MIKAWWFNNEGENFGDAICPWILEKMTKQEIVRSEDEGSLASIGSILMYGYSSPKVIWGSGAISDYHSSPMLSRHKILAVRGPKSRDRLLEEGFACPEVYGDPSLLLPYLVDGDVEKEYEVSYLPHWVDLQLLRSNKTISENYNIIDIRSGIDNVLTEIRKSKRVISSSLHGIIVPEAFGIPSYFTRISTRVTDEIENEFGIIGSRWHGMVGKRKWFNHKPVPEIKRDLGEDLFNSYRKVCNIRNPYDLSVSYYHFMGNKELSKSRFESFVKNPSTVHTLKTNSDLWSDAGVYNFDYIRMENLQSDLNSFLDKIGCHSKSSFSLPHFKKSSGRGDYRDYYNSSSRQTVEKIYGKEIELFSYKF